MTNAAVFIGWGSPWTGREVAALQVFQEAVQCWAGLQQQGTIESFEAVQLEPHGGDLAGFCLIKGDRQQLSQLRYTEEFQRLNARAGAVVANFGIVDAHIGEDMQHLFSVYQQAAAELGG